jgi:hypothetical protein
MALGSGAIKLNLELWKKGYFKNIQSVIEMGTQQLDINLEDIEELLCEAGISAYKKEKIAALSRWPNAFCSSQVFYEMLGIKNYACIDLNKEHGAIPLDLNYPLEDKSFYGKYDLVTDYGNNEHIFNTAEAYRTMYRLCKSGGILSICQSIFKGSGSYSYDPSFFEGMAAANNYKILFSSFLITTGSLTSLGSSYQYHVPLSWELVDKFDWTKIKELRVFYVMQKQSDADFREPYQGVYLSLNQKHHGYQLEYAYNPPSRSYVPVHALNGIPDKMLFSEFYRRLYRKIKIHLRLS